MRGCMYQITPPVASFARCVSPFINNLRAKKDALETMVFMQFISECPTWRLFLGSAKNNSSLQSIFNLLVEHRLTKGGGGGGGGGYRPTGAASDMARARARETAKRSAAVTAGYPFLAECG